MLSSISYINSFLSTGLLSPELRFIPRYFILVDVTVHRVFFLISLLDGLLYRNATHFCMLILCVATSVNSLTSSNSFGSVSRGFAIYTQDQVF